METGFHVERSHADASWALSAELDEREVEDQHVMIVSGPDWASQLALPYILHWGKRVLPKSSEVLSPSPASAASITRVGPNVIDLHLSHSSRGAFERAGYRRVETEFRIDDRLSLGRYTAVIIATEGGEPIIVRFFFPNNVDDQRYVFLHAYADGLKRFPMPRVGETIALPQPAWPSGAY